MFNGQALPSKFKQKLLSLLIVLYKQGQLKTPPKDTFWNSKSSFYRTKSMLYDIDWVVYAKESFGGPQQVIEYLGRYTHKIAISNYRILKVTSTHVYFKYLDRKAEKTRVEKVTGERFIQRFMQHVLPKRFMKIRHYGFLSSRSKSADLEQIRRILNATSPELTRKLNTRELMIKINGKDPYLCPRCKKDSMVVVEITPGARGSPKALITSGKALKLWIND